MGRRHFCTLRSAALREACDWMDQYRRLWNESFDQLDLVLKSLARETGAYPSRLQMPDRLEELLLREVTPHAS